MSENGTQQDQENSAAPNLFDPCENFEVYYLLYTREVIGRGEGSQGSLAGKLSWTKQHTLEPGSLTGEAQKILSAPSIMSPLTSHTSTLYVAYKGPSKSSLQHFWITPLL